MLRQVVYMLPARMIVNYSCPLRLSLPETEGALTKKSSCTHTHRLLIRLDHTQSQPDTSYQQSVAASVTPSTLTLIGTGLPPPEGLHVYRGPALLGPVAGTQGLFRVVWKNE